MADVSLKTIVLCWLYHGVFSLPFREWTLHTYKRNWNDANAICQSTGGQLATPTDDQAAEVFYTFMNRPPWKGEIGISCLVRVGRNRETKGPEWYDCTNPVPVWGETSGFMDKECGTLYVYGKTIATVNCHGDLRSFACEHIINSSCIYTKVLGGEPDILPASSSSMPYIGCSTACNMSDECMAFVYDGKAETCKLYEPTDLLYFENGAHITFENVWQDTYYKTCFSARIETDDTQLAVSPRLDPMSFDCGRTEPVATVFTIINEPKTWDEAVQSCGSMGQSIATISDSDTLYVVQTLEGNTTQAYHWVGFREQGNGTVDWLTGGAVSVFFSEDPPQANLACGALQLSTGYYQLFDCSLKMPYICQQLKDRCGYHVTAATKGVDFTDHGEMSDEACMNLCDGLQNCQAFVYTPGGLLIRKACYTRTMSNWLVAFHPDFEQEITYDKNSYLARWTCIWCNVEMRYHIEETTSTEESPSTGVSESMVPTPTTIAQAATSGEPGSSATSYYSDLSSSNQTFTLSFTYPVTDVIIETNSFASQEINMTLNTIFSSDSGLSLATSFVNTDSQSVEETILPTDSDSVSSLIITLQQEISSSIVSSLEYIAPSTATNELSSSSLGYTETTPKSSAGAGGGSGGSNNNSGNGNGNHSSTAPNGMCWCACPPNMTMGAPSDSNFDDLLIPIESTNAYKRSKESVYDSRPSARGIGVVACVCLSTALFLIALSDAVTFWGYGIFYLSN